MVKAIVKINAFLDKKQIEATYNFIYGQLKSGSEVIIVPNYCDVYAIDGADIEVQKNAKIETTSENKDCLTCKYETNPIPEEPCYSCIHGLCDENLNRTEKWEAKE